VCSVTRFVADQKLWLGLCPYGRGWKGQADGRGWGRVLIGRWIENEERRESEGRRGGGMGRLREARDVEGED